MSGRAAGQPSGARRGAPPLRPLELLATLREHNVAFIVIGGFSLAAHGYVRATKDVDIVPQPGRANLERLLGALEALDAEHLALDDFKPEELPALTLENLVHGGGNWLLRTRLGRLDVMQYVEGLQSYGQLRAAAVEPEVEELPAGVLFAGLDDLIALKRASGREQDLLDIAELERARGLGA